MMSSSSPCLSANPDVSGIGVRTAIYVQNLLSFVPAFYALFDGTVSFDELDSIETQAMTILITALALLLSAIIEAVTQDLSAVHAAIILNLSWMNNTNLFIYLLLYMHHKAGLEEAQGESPWGWPFWWRVARNVLRWKKKQLHKHPDEARPRLFVILLGTLHLSLMAAVGFWLWIHPSSYGRRPISLCSASPIVFITGRPVPMTSNGLQGVSFVMYSLVLLPLFNIIIPSAFVLFFYVNFNRKFKDMPKMSRFYPVVALACFQNPWRRALGASPNLRHRVFPISVGLCILAAINVIFLIDTELTIHHNRQLQEVGEDRWSFGQTLALLLLLIPLRDVAEGLRKRRERSQEERIRHSVKKTQEATADFRVSLINHDLSRTKEYIGRGADLDTADNHNRTALILAVEKGQSDLVRFLVKHGANMNMKSEDGSSAMIIAAKKGQSDTTQFLVEQGANMNLQDWRGCSALIMAAKKGHMQVVQYLVDSGANINLQNRNGSSAMIIAAKKGHTDINRCLTEHGGDVNLQNRCHYSALMMASKKGYLAIAQCLVDNGADVNMQDQNGSSAIIIAAENSQAELVGFLIHNGADVNLLNRSRYSALMMAAKKGYMQVAHCLIDNGADVNLQNRNSFSALMLAVWNGETDIARFLIEHGADVNLHNIHGRSALMMAAMMGYMEVAQLLVDKGADVNLQDENGLSPLMYAARHGFVRIIRLLLDRGANPNAKNLKGYTALQLAREYRKAEVVKDLSSVCIEQ